MFLLFSTVFKEKFCHSVFQPNQMPQRALCSKQDERWSCESLPHKHQLHLKWVRLILFRLHAYLFTGKNFFLKGIFMIYDVKRFTSWDVALPQSFQWQMGAYGNNRIRSYKHESVLAHGRYSNNILFNKNIEFSITRHKHNAKRHQNMESQSCLFGLQYVIVYEAILPWIFEGILFAVGKKKRRNT